MDKFSELKAAAMAATPGAWEWFTSNSMARLSSTPSGKDGDVLSAFCASDGVPCVSVSQHDMAFIAAANPAVVLALLAELEFEKQNNAGVAGMVEDYETKLEAKDKRIEELEILLDRNIKRAKKLGEQLDTPVQLQNCDFESVAIMAHWCTDEQLKAWVKGVEHAKKQIRAAGFKVEGDE